MIISEKSSKLFDSFMSTSPKRRSVKTCYYYLLLLCGLASIYYVISIRVLQNYRIDLFKPSLYWKELQGFNNILPQTFDKSQNCITTKNVNEKSLEQLRIIMEFFNSHKSFNYFLCFSSLYFTTKLENYDVFRARLNESKFNQLNDFYKIKNRNKCIETEFSCRRNNGFESALETRVNVLHNSKIHICMLKENHKNTCDFIVESFKATNQNNINLNCVYNIWNGEYELRVSAHLKLIIHEYEATSMTSTRLSYWKLQPWWWFPIRSNETSLNSEEKADDDNAKLKMGLIEYLFGVDFFEVPLYFFYNQESRNEQNYYYVNYLGLPFRLPSEIVNYFMLFYSKTWYL